MWVLLTIDCDEMTCYGYPKFQNLKTRFDVLNMSSESFKGSMVGNESLVIARKLSRGFDRIYVAVSNTNPLYSLVILLTQCEKEELKPLRGYIAKVFSTIDRLPVMAY